MSLPAPRDGEVLHGPHGPLPAFVPKAHEGHPPAFELGPVQRALHPWADTMVVLWWVVFAGVLSRACWKLAHPFVRRA